MRTSILKLVLYTQLVHCMYKTNFTTRVCICWVSLLHILDWITDKGSYKTTDTALFNAMRRLRTYCPYCQNITWCHGTRVKVLTLRPVWNVQSSLRLFFRSPPQYSVLMSLTAFHPNRTINFEITERIFSHAFNKVWNALSRFSWHSCFGGKFYWEHDKLLSGWH